MASGDETNRKSWRLGEYLIVRKADLRPSDQQLDRLPNTQGTIAQWMKSQVQRPIATEMLEAVVGRVSVTSFGANPANITSYVESKLLWCFDRKILVALRRAPGGSGADAADGTSAAPPPPPPKKNAPPPPPPAPAQEKTWFRCQLLDEDGEVMANEPFILDDSNGVHREGKLDAQGMIYIPPSLVPGNCKISFPKINLNPLKKK